MLGSVLDMKSLDEFLTLATMSNKNFEAEKVRNTVLVSDNVLVDPRAQEKKFLDCFYAGNEQNAKSLSLRIPRRPKWNKGMDRLELQTLENVQIMKTS